MLQLTPDNFKEKISRKGITLVLFHTGYCPFCRVFAPFFQRAESMLKGIYLAEARLDEDENPLWDKLNIQVVPTMIAFRNGKQIAIREGKPGLGLSEGDFRIILEELDEIK